jgi:hypothetical protein
MAFGPTTVDQTALGHEGRIRLHLGNIHVVPSSVSPPLCSSNSYDQVPSVTMTGVGSLTCFFYCVIKANYSFQASLLGVFCLIHILWRVFFELAPICAVYLGSPFTLACAS